MELSAAYIDGMRDSDPNAALQESGLPVLLTYSGNERILSDTTQTETKAGRRKPAGRPGGAGPLRER